MDTDEHYPPEEPAEALGAVAPAVLSANVLGAWAVLQAGAASPVNVTVGAVAFEFELLAVIAVCGQGFCSPHTHACTHACTHTCTHTRFPLPCVQAGPIMGEFALAAGSCCYCALWCVR